MPVPKWFVIAKNEYLVRTSTFRSIRRYLPFIVIPTLAVYVAFIAPAMVNLLIDELLALFLSQVAVAVVQILLFTIFSYFIVLPIAGALRQTEMGRIQILVSAPVRPSDVLLGEFLGAVPLYTVVVTIVAGLFTAALNPLGLDLAQMGIIIAIFILTLFSGLWIGTVLGAILRTRFAETARGRDIGGALAMVAALPMILLTYGLMSGALLEVLADPGTSGIVITILGLLPSSWGAEVIINFARNPGNISALAVETLTRFGGLVAFFVGALWLGSKAADRAYSLEPTAFIASRVTPDGSFYKIIRFIGGGGSFGSLLVSLFKDYSRRLENLSKIFYGIAVLGMVSLFLVDDARSALLLPIFTLPVLVSFVVGELTLRGKHTLLIYRKAPSGVRRFVKARLLHGCLIVVPIVGAFTFISTIARVTPQLTFYSILTYAGLAMLSAAATVTFVLGLFLLNPAFSDKSASYIINLNITIFGLSNGFFLVPVMLLGYNHLLSTISFVSIPLTWVAAIILLYVGHGKLSRME